MDAIARRDLRRLLIATLSFIPWAGVFFTCNLPSIRPPTRLMEAVRLEWLQEVQALIAQGVDVNEKGAFGTTALWLAVDQMDVRLAKVLIAAGANVNERRDSGTLLLSDMLRRGRAPERQREMVELLLAGGADVRARSFEDGRTVLHYATRPDVVRLLLAAGADVDAADCMGNTPISRTVGNVMDMPKANLELMRQLLEAGAHPPQQAVVRMQTVAVGDERILALLGRATVIAPEPYRDGPCGRPGRPDEVDLARKAWGDRHGLRLPYFVWELLSGPFVILAWFSPPFLLAIGGLITRDFALGAWSAPLLLLIVVGTAAVLSFVPGL